LTDDTTVGMGAFAVELPIFAGPFKLLADLLLEKKVDVCDVSIASITDRFLEYSKLADAWTLDEATWFLAVCAVLLEIKVGRLMPKHESGLEDDLSESPDLAYARSLELTAFRRAAVDIANRMQDNARYFPRDVGPAKEFADLYPDIMEKVRPEQLAAMAASLLRLPAELDLSHVTPIRLTVAEAMVAVEERLNAMPNARFRELVSDCVERIHVVVRFLALLELFRDGKVELSQAETFGEIDVTWQGG
jgi:segregation and condensation protein A